MAQKLKKMTKTEVTDVQLKACRNTNFKAGADLAKKVNRIIINVDQTLNKELEKECLNVDVKWIAESEKSECGEI